MIVILSDDLTQDTGEKFYEMIKSKTQEVQYISVSNLNISTCYNCSYCRTKEYGKCVIQDDMQDLLYTVAQSTQLILVCPITFGSYSSKMKKIFDRLVVLGDIRYYVVNKELVKGTVTNQDFLWSIGVKEGCSLEEKALFTNLAYENRKVMNVSGECLVVDDTSRTADLEKFAEVIVNA